MKILLIEDDLDDIELMQDALFSRNISYTIETINDGGKAINYIKNCKEGPDIIILDLNLPKVHGREVILEIKSAAHLKTSPLLILTTSSAKADIEYAYSKGADRYLIKPTDIEKINEMVDTIVRLANKGASKLHYD